MERPDEVDAAADEMEADLQEMQQRSEELDEEVGQARQDWRRKQEDSSVPGAEPTEPEEAGGEVAGDWEGEGEAADDAGQ